MSFKYLSLFSRWTHTQKDFQTREYICGNGQQIYYENDEAVYSFMKRQIDMNRDIQINRYEQSEEDRFIGRYEQVERHNRLMNRQKDDK